MKQLFLDVTARLDTLTALNWADEEKGQMNFEQPPVVFPAALVAISTPQRRSINDNHQNVVAQVQVILAFDFMGNTNTKTPAVARAKSLEYYDVVEAVKNLLHGFSTATISTMDCTSIVQLPRPDQYKTVALTFTTSFFDANGAV